MTRHQRYYARHSERILAKRRAKNAEELEKRRREGEHYSPPESKVKRNLTSTEYTNRPENRLRTRFNLKKNGAKALGLRWELTFDDVVWPTHCPVLGIELDYSYGGKGGPRNNSPSMDRRDPSKGYTSENTVVMSQRANRIKNDGTLDELRAIVKWMENS